MKPSIQRHYEVYKVLRDLSPNKVALKDIADECRRMSKSQISSSIVFLLGHRIINRERAPHGSTPLYFAMNMGITSVEEMSKFHHAPAYSYPLLYKSGRVARHVRGYRERSATKQIPLPLTSKPASPAATAALNEAFKFVSPKIHVKLGTINHELSIRDAQTLHDELHTLLRGDR